MVATPWTVILLFSRTNPFIKCAVSSGLLTDGHTERSSFLMQVTRILTSEKQSLICVFHIVCSSQATFNILEVSGEFSPT
jgi:hypothetical protein